MKLIKLTQGRFAQVDDEDFERVNQFKWSAHKNGNVWYSTRRNGKSSESMHSFIMGHSPKGMHVDHKDGDGLNNQKCNLRFCTPSQNSMNRGIKNGGTSIYKGISWLKAANQWSASIRHNDKRIYHKYFKNEIMAAKQYDIWATELFGEFARLNFPENPCINE